MFGKNMSATRQRSGRVRQSLVLFLFTLFVPSLVFAGGLDAGTTTLSSVETWAYGTLAIIAGLYMIYLILTAWSKHGTWMQVLIGCAEVAAAGGVIVLVKYLWSIWGSGA